VIRRLAILATLVLAISAPVASTTRTTVKGSLSTSIAAYNFSSTVVQIASQNA
jgi:hypothetical protein